MLAAGGPNIIHFQGECTGAIADKVSKVDRRGPKACRKTEEFGVYLVGTRELQKASLPGTVYIHLSVSSQIHSLPFSCSAQYSISQAALQLASI